MVKNGRKKQALDFYSQALKLRREVKDKAGEGITLTSMGTIWLDLGNRQKALELYDEALSLLQDVGDLANQASTYFNIAMIYAYEGDFKTAVNFLERTVSIDILIQHPDLESDKQKLEEFKARRDKMQQ